MKDQPVMGASLAADTDWWPADAEQQSSPMELVSQQSCWVDGQELTMQLLRQAQPADNLTPAMVRTCDPILAAVL